MAEGIKKNIGAVQSAAAAMAVASIPNVPSIPATIAGNSVSNTTNINQNVSIATNDPFKAAKEQQRLLRRLAFQGGI